MECTLENILPHVYGLDEKRLAARLSLYLAVSDGAQIAYSGGHGASVGLQQNVSLRAVDGGGLASARGYGACPTRTETGRDLAQRASQGTGESSGGCHWHSAGGRHGAVSGICQKRVVGDWP